MKKINILLFALFAIFVLSACDGTAPSESTQNNDDSIADQNAEAENIDVDRTSSTEGTVQVDLDGDLTVDATIEVTENLTTATVDWEAPTGVSATEYCVPGSVFAQDSLEMQIDAKVIGLEMYKGKEYCRAEALHITEQEYIGEMRTETVYYFDNTYNEFWVTSTVTNAMMPEPQVIEMHIVNGVVQ
jgi:outer membrane biogenesis lipoprotein LolB